jgi:hypothetical protein
VRAAPILLAALALAGSADAQRRSNLVPNGGFEKGANGCPQGWDRPDGLTSFWVKDPLRKGRCMRFDSDVYQGEYAARREQMKRPDPPPPRPKKPTSGAKYDTVGGINGVPFFSEFIAIDPKTPYRISVEFMPGAAGLPGAKLVPKVFIKGYVSIQREVWDEERQRAVSRAIDRVAFKEYKNLEGGEAGKWTRTTFYSWPGRRNPKITRAKLMLFPYWPPGEYFFDNVRLEPMDVETWEKESALLRELERREKARAGKVLPGRGAGNPPSKRRKNDPKKAGGG